MSKKNPFSQAKFIISVATDKQLPIDQGAEVAFAGRSNAGKSSAINAITGVKGLAKTSKTPGCTQLLNFFAFDDKQHLVDLPGYGYAKVPETTRLRWINTLEHYLHQRQSLKGLILVTDIRHPLNPFDQQMLGWANQSQLPIHILLTKADKLSRGAANIALQQVLKALANNQNAITAQLFSAKSGMGLEEARRALLTLLKI